MKYTHIYLIFNLLSIYSIAFSQQYAISINTSEGIKVNIPDSIIYLERGKDLQLELIIDKFWIEGNLSLEINGVKEKYIYIDKEMVEINIGKIEKNTKIFIQTETRYILGKISYYETSDFGDFFYLLNTPPPNLPNTKNNIYKKIKSEWKLVYSHIQEPNPSLSLRNESTKFWNYKLETGYEYKATVEFFRYNNKGERIPIVTVISPNFTKDYLTTNNTINKIDSHIFKQQGTLHIQTNHYPQQIYIYTSNGKLIKNFTQNNFESSTPLSIGIYFVIVGDQKYKILMD